MPVGVSAYVALANFTIPGVATEVSFTSISQSYRDLILVINARSGDGSPYAPGLRINGVTSSYKYAIMFGLGSGSGGATTSSGNSWLNLSGNQSILGNGFTTIVAQLNDYSATNKIKTVISRADTSTSATTLVLGANESTSAITSLAVGNGTYAAGSSFALYGIAS